MIERISFSNPNVPKRLTNTINFAGAEDTNLSQGKGMKEKSDAAKYMIGAAALAGVIAVGIIGHKNNWFSKVKDIGGDLLDFSKIKGEKLTKNVEGKKVYVIQQKGNDGKLVQELISKDNKRLNRINKFQADGKTIDSVADYSPETGKMLKETKFQIDGKTPYLVTDYSPETGKMLKETVFLRDGKTLDYVTDYSPETGEFLKTTVFFKDGGVIVV